VLSRLLTEHGVASDTAESAELALDYLKHSRPDVVFLDHNMPGLGGFEALEAIKRNPATATIPVMMYTSEEGEVYVGQARALGAIGVLPKTMQPVAVAQVLRSLHLIPSDTEPALADADIVADTPPTTPASALPGDLPLNAERLRPLLEELFSEQLWQLRGEMRREMRRELTRFSEATAQPPLSQPDPLAQLAPFVPKSRPIERALTLASAMLVIVCGVLAYLYFATNSTLDSANRRIEQLAADTATLSDASEASLAAAQPTTRGQQDSVLAVLEWGVNQGGSFGYGAVPLDDRRAALVATMFEQLERLRFAGVVAIDVHVGRFCMNYDPDGTLVLAPPEQLAGTCERIGWPETEAVTLGERQSVAFANAVSTATARNPRLRVETVSHGSMDPVVDYPTMDFVLTAGAWNAVAAANQRVAFRLLPNDVPARR